MRTVNLHRRVAALVLIAAWVLPIAGASVHSEGHGHRYCEEHRAFEESEVAASAAQTKSALGAWSTQKSVPAATLKHLQCPVAHPASRDAALGGAVEVTAKIVAWVAASSATDAVVHASLDVLRLAPKASPPRA